MKYHVSYKLKAKGSEPVKLGNYTLAEGLEALGNVAKENRRFAWLKLEPDSAALSDD